MTLNNLVTKLAHKKSHKGLAERHTLYYCFQCVDEYLRGEREQIAMKVDPKGQTIYRKPPIHNMRQYYDASSMICDNHWEHRKKIIKG
jgi:hypothetical protein